MILADRGRCAAASFSSTVYPVLPFLLLPRDYDGFLAIVAEFQLGSAGQTDSVVGRGTKN